MESSEVPAVVAKQESIMEHFWPQQVPGLSCYYCCYYCQEDIKMAHPNYTACNGPDVGPQLI